MLSRLLGPSVLVLTGQKGKVMENLYDVNCMVSPSNFEGETKDQDRTVFDSRTCTASLCDGVTSSPHSGKAASIMTNQGSLILENIDMNLKIVADLLYANRSAALKRGVVVDSSISASMKEVVQEAAKQSLKHSFQTTLIATRFDVQSSFVSVKCLSCGDSGFFAFSSKGQMMTTNLVDLERHPEQYHQPQSTTIPFSPGCELLTKTMGCLSEFPNLEMYKEINNPDKWLLCSAICLCDTPVDCGEPNAFPTMYLKPNELLVIPRYLLTKPKDPDHQEFGRLYYSQFIRRLSCPAITNTDIRFDGQGNTTFVLPDHYDSGNWESFEDKFPRDTSFLLCSDGFYRAFLSPSDMWEWLKTNEKGLLNKAKRRKLLKDLHLKLNHTCGDDDISLIWITPKNSKGMI